MTRGSPSSASSASTSASVNCRKTSRSVISTTTTRRIVSPAPVVPQPHYPSLGPGAIGLSGPDAAVAAGDPEGCRRAAYRGEVLPAEVAQRPCQLFLIHAGLREREAGEGAWRRLGSLPQVNTGCRHNIHDSPNRPAAAYVTSDVNKRALSSLPEGRRDWSPVTKPVSGRRTLRLGRPEHRP